MCVTACDSFPGCVLLLVVGNVFKVNNNRLVRKPEQGCM